MRVLGQKKIRGGGAPNAPHSLFSVKDMKKILKHRFKIFMVELRLQSPDLAQIPYIWFLIG